jgi:tRNA(adenine34) deaminase
MKAALEEAGKALQKEEVPVGAVLVKQGQIISNGHNSSIMLNDPSAHAEIIALRQGGKLLGNYRLADTELYVTVEPCIMCMGALLHARVKTLIFGAHDQRAGAAGSVCDFTCDDRLNHKLEVRAGVLEAECRNLMQLFFRKKRCYNTER